MLGPLILTAENVVGMMTGSIIATLVLGIEPRKYYDKAVARKLMLRTFVFFALLILLLFSLSLIAHFPPFY